MSRTSGKIEILAIENGFAYLKYHQSRDDEYGKFMVLECPDDAAWFDDLPGNDAHRKKPEKNGRISFPSTSCPRNLACPT